MPEEESAHGYQERDLPYGDAVGIGLRLFQAVKVGDTIYVSGQVDHDEVGKVLYPGAMERQMRQAYANVKRVLLAHFGATMDNIVDEILFVVDMDSAMRARGRLKDEIYGQAILPAATIVQIQRLALPDFTVEIHAIAREPLSVLTWDSRSASLTFSVPRQAVVHRLPHRVGQRQLLEILTILPFSTTGLGLGKIARVRILAMPVSTIVRNGLGSIGGIGALILGYDLRG
jgi:enamine deaminase RidA (YjgF/YER057c/UK114 family)